MTKPILILQTGDLPEDVPCQENFQHMFLRTACYSQPPQIIHAVREPLPDHAQSYAGIIITGSPAMVTDREAWSERCAAWLREEVHRGTPMLGICYGHQLLAHAMGGQVGPHPQGMELGTHTITLAPKAAQYPLFADMPSTFSANLFHGQTVLTPPTGATILASSQHDPCQILSYGPAIFSLQFHPEFDGTVMKACQKAYGHEATALGVPIQDTPVAASILQRFIDLHAG